MSDQRWLYHTSSTWTRKPHSPGWGGVYLSRLSWRHTIKCKRIHVRDSLILAVLQFYTQGRCSYQSGIFLQTWFYLLSFLSFTCETRVSYGRTSRRPAGPAREQFCFHNHSVYFQPSWRVTSCWKYQKFDLCLYWSKLHILSQSPQVNSNKQAQSLSEVMHSKPCAYVWANHLLSFIFFFTLIIVLIIVSD